MVKGCLIVIKEVYSFFDFALIQLDIFFIFTDEETELEIRLMLKKWLLRVYLDSGLFDRLSSLGKRGVDGLGFGFGSHEFL